MEEKERKRKKLPAVLLTILAVAAVIVGILTVVRVIGKENLRTRVGDAKPAMDGENISSIEDIMNAQNGSLTWQEDWIRYDGEIYEYNDDLMTFLVMGIDKTGEVTDSQSATDGGQADAIFLVVADTAEKEISIVAVNRDTMVDINAVNFYGEGESATAYAQIAVQHGFGDGKEQSCELMEDAVSSLFYDLPINGYIAINMDAIPVINDAVGGVTVTALEDVAFDEKGRSVWHEGDEIHLQGMEAYYYVRWRDTAKFESARGRLARQKQYLEGFIGQAITATQNNITLPITLYRQLSDYMVTDISIDETAYLAGEMIHYTFDTHGIYTMEGETKEGEAHEEFYPDEKAMEALMVDVFYRRVEGME